eukprot:CFRG1930T1
MSKFHKAEQEQLDSELHRTKELVKLKKSELSEVKKKLATQVKLEDNLIERSTKLEGNQSKQREELAKDAANSAARERFAGNLLQAIQKKKNLLSEQRNDFAKGLEDLVKTLRFRMRHYRDDNIGEEVERVSREIADLETRVTQLDDDIHVAKSASDIPLTAVLSTPEHQTCSRPFPISTEKPQLLDKRTMDALLTACTETRVSLTTGKLSVERLRQVIPDDWDDEESLMRKKEDIKRQSSYMQEMVNYLKLPGNLVHTKENTQILRLIHELST